MNCPHCGKPFHDDWKEMDLAQSELVSRHLGRAAKPFIGWKSRMANCPSCKDDIIELQKLRYPLDKGPVLLCEFRAYPQNIFRKPVPMEVPEDIKADFEEACKVLPISAKSAATLSRRCLQAVLQEQGYAQKNLMQQIDALLQEEDPKRIIPTTLHGTIDAIRNYGNFSAHPLTDQTTLQVISVEPGEAEWCLNILEELFDYYYVKPARALALKAELDKKLQAAGKPRSK